jgi:hypothetical protein
MGMEQPWPAYTVLQLHISVEETQKYFECFFSLITSVENVTKISCYSDGI